MFPVFCLQDELVACSSNNSVKHTLHSPIRAHAIAIHMPRIATRESTGNVTNKKENLRFNRKM